MGQPRSGAKGILEDVPRQPPATSLLRPFPQGRGPPSTQGAGADGTTSNRKRAGSSSSSNPFSAEVPQHATPTSHWPALGHMSAPKPIMCGARYEDWEGGKHAAVRTEAVGEAAAGGVGHRAGLTF